LTGTPENPRQPHSTLGYRRAREHATLPRRRQRSVAMWRAGSQRSRRVRRAAASELQSDQSRPLRTHGRKVLIWWRRSWRMSRRSRKRSRYSPGSTPRFLARDFCFTNASGAMCNERKPLDCLPGAYLDRSEEMLFRLTNGQDGSICLRYSAAKSEEQRACRNAKFWERS
jgi:hypothetical protein